MPAINIVLQTRRGEIFAYNATSYHGKVSQVEFDQISPWTRTTPRCELADVLFVAYTATELRITFLQAKSVNSLSPFPLRLANTEQYALLALRPKIKYWHGDVVWNEDILSNSLLPSVGSFGVFYQGAAGSVEFFYVSADLLVSTLPPSLGRYVSGKFDYCSFCHILRKATSPPFMLERVICSNMSDFGAALYSMSIGTPIDSTVDGNAIIGTNGVPTSRGARVALYKLIRNEIETEGANDIVLNELYNSAHFQDLRTILGDTEGISGVSGLVVVKGEH